MTSIQVNNEIVSKTHALKKKRNTQKQQQQNPEISSSPLESKRNKRTGMFGMRKLYTTILVSNILPQMVMFYSIYLLHHSFN